jgi:hypothetical protein
LLNYVEERKDRKKKRLPPTSTPSHSEYETICGHAHKEEKKKEVE